MSKITKAFLVALVLSAIIILGQSQTDQSTVPATTTTGSPTSTTTATTTASEMPLYEADSISQITDDLGGRWDMWAGQEWHFNLDLQQKDNIITGTMNCLSRYELETYVSGQVSSNGTVEFIRRGPPGYNWTQYYVGKLTATPDHILMNGNFNSGEHLEPANSQWYATAELRGINAEIIEPIHWPEGSYKPWNMVDVQYTIKNTGTESHKFYLGASVRGPDDNWINLPYRETRDLAPGEEIADLLRWTVPEDAVVGSYDITIAVWKDKTADGEELVDELDRETREDQFQIEARPIVEGNVKAEIIEPIYWPEGSYKPWNMVDVHYTIKNIGTESHKFYLGAFVRGPDENWINLPYRETRDLAPGEEIADLLRWTVPGDAAVGSYDITIAVGKDKTADGDELVDELDRETREDQFQIEPRPDNGGEVPSTGSKTFILWAGDAQSINLPGARVSVDGDYIGDTDEKGEVRADLAFGSHTVTIQADCGEITRDFSFRESIDGVALTIDTCSAEFNTVQDGCGRILSYSISNGAYSPGQLIIADMGYKSEYDGELTFKGVLLVKAPDGKIYSGSKKQRTPALQENGYGANRGNSIQVRIPEDAPSGEYSVKLELCGVDDRLCDSEGWIEDQFQIEARPEVEGNVKAEIIEPIYWPDGTFKPWDMVDVQYTIRNTGTESHKFYLGASVRGPDGNWINLPNRETRELSPGEEILDLLRWTVPEDAAVGNYDITIAVWKDKTADGEELVDELDREAREDQFQIEARPVVEGNVKAEIIEPIYWPEGSYKPWNMVDVQYTIRNTGTESHKFYLGASVRGPDDNWINLPYRETRDLAPGEEIRDLLRWAVPEDAFIGSYDITIAVWKDKTPDGEELVDELDRETREDQFQIESLTSDERPVESDQQWSYYGSAYLDIQNDYMVLTPNKTYQVGNIWLNQDIFSPFSIEFGYKAGGGTGADGLILMFYKNKNYEPGSGGRLGFNAASDEGVSGYGIEFDNWKNSEPCCTDPTERHIALIKDSAANHLIWVEDPRTEDNQWHKVMVQVNNRSVSVYLDNSNIFTFEGEISASYGGLGFSAATGSYDNWHLIDDVRINPLASTSLNSSSVGS
jgi:uncharacterized membrane protein